MDKKLTSYLRGFYSYKRSFNKRVLTDDNEIHEAYTKAEQIGELPFNRTKILILGDHAAGKTSTFRRLQGKSFREDEPSTVGIETNIINANVNDVNSNWSEIKTTPIEDYERSAAWWAVSHLLHLPANTTMETRTTHDNNTQQLSSRRLIEDIFYQILQIVPTLIMFLFGGFTFGFGFVAWVYIVCLMSIVDVHSAYRFGSGYTIAMVVIDRAMCIDEYNTTLQVMGLDYWNGMSAFMLVFMFGISGLVIGILLGSGGRTGMCIAFCLMVHPGQKVFNIKHVTKTLITYNSKLYFKLMICIFSGMTIVLFKYFYGNILTKTHSTCIFFVLSMIIFFTSTAYIGTPYFLLLFTALCIAVIVFLTSIGIIIGRKLVAYGYIPNSYSIKKSIGFIAGLLIATVCGWELRSVKPLNLQENLHGSLPHFVFQLIVFVAPMIGFIIYERCAYIKVKNASSNWMVYIRKSMEASIRNESYLEARLSLWDFAGQDMYYNTHHLFMPKQAVYLIVFNAVEAVLNPAKQIKRLQFWLQSVAMHADIENAVVLLVGTRRQDIWNSNDLLKFTRLVDTHLYKRFSKLLGFHPSGSFFFLIENVMQVDQERNILQEAIYNEIKKMNYFHKPFSINYLLLNQTLNTFRARKCIITSLNEITDEMKSSNITLQSELRHILKFFNKAGDIIYNDSDELLRNYVICDPQMLVDILQCLVNVPEEHTRELAVAAFWRTLEYKGIVDSRLLKYLCREKGIGELYICIIRFLVGTYLLFPLNVTDKVNQVGTFFLSSRLPKISVISTIWNSVDHSEDVFYFDFGEILPEFIFLRLIAKCCEAFTWEEMYYNAAIFSKSEGFLLFMKTDVITEGVFNRNLIIVEIQTKDQVQCINVLQKLIDFTKEIIKREFNPDYFQGQYIFGPKCDRCSSSDGTMRLVNLTLTDNDISSIDGFRPDHYHKFLVGTKLGFSCSNKR